MGSGCGAILVGVTAMSNVGIARGDHFVYWGGRSRVGFMILVRGRVRVTVKYLNVGLYEVWGSP